MSVAVQDYNWRALASCRGAGYDEMFPDDPTADASAKYYCQHCPVIENCLKEAIATDSRDGIRGGMSEAQRLPLHLEREQELASSPKPIPIRRLDRILSVDSELELRDLSDEQGHEGSRKYRMKLGELYESGVSIIQLLNAGAPNDRMIWRGIREYRISLGEYEVRNTCISALEPKESKRQKIMRKRAYQNYSKLAKSAPNESARLFWQQKANCLFY